MTLMTHARSGAGTSDAVHDLQAGSGACLDMGEAQVGAACGHFTARGLAWVQWGARAGPECLTHSRSVETHQGRDATKHADGGRSVGSRRTRSHRQCASAGLCEWLPGPSSFRMHQTWVSTTMQTYPRRNVTSNGPQELITHRVGEGARPPPNEGLGIRRSGVLISLAANGTGHPQFRAWVAPLTGPRFPSSNKSVRSLCVKNSQRDKSPMDSWLRAGWCTF